MREAHILNDVRKAVLGAADTRRGLIAYSKMEAMEMDRRARSLERDALEQVRAALPPMPALPLLHQIHLRLQRMDERLDELSSREGIAEISRTLENDDIVWRTFEDVLELLEGSA
ncbi:MAG TPA: hypothetical protein VGK88_08425 [bacterium]|jgi:hypothetical protein